MIEDHEAARLRAEASAEAEATRWNQALERAIQREQSFFEAEQQCRARAEAAETALARERAEHEAALSTAQIATQETQEWRSRAEEVRPCP